MFISKKEAKLVKDFLIKNNDISITDDFELQDEKTTKQQTLKNKVVEPYGHQKSYENFIGSEFAQYIKSISFNNPRFEMLVANKIKDILFLQEPTIASLYSINVKKQPTKIILTFTSLLTNESFNIDVNL